MNDCHAVVTLIITDIYIFFFSISFLCYTTVYKLIYKISRPQLVTFCPSGAAHDQRVFLSSNNPTPCFGDTVDLICYYPDVMETVNSEDVVHVE